MTDTTLNAPAPKKRRGWFRKLIWAAGILIILLVIAYFVVTSAAFLKGVILPRVSKAINADITVSDASIRPFKEIVLRNLRVQTSGAEPLLTATEVRARYNLMDILHGSINVEEVVVSSPTVVVVENSDKSSNLDPLMKSQAGKAKEPPAKSAKPAQIDIRKVALTDATVRKVRVYKNGNRDVTELSHVNITLDDLKNGQPGKLGLSADIKVENNPPAPGASGSLQAKLDGSFGFTLTGDLKPAAVKGNTHLEVSRAEGTLAELTGLGADLDCEVTPTDIKQAALHFQKNGTRLGEVRVSGPFDMEKTEGRLAVAILSIDKQLLNLAGAKSGMDFGTTLLNSTNEIQLAKAGSLITAAGQLSVSKFEVTRASETTPPLDFQAGYNVTVDLAQSNAVVRGLTLTGTQRGNPILQAELANPMQIAWGGAANAVGDSTFKFTVAGLSLTDWKPFLGNLAPAGTVDAQVKLLSEQGGQQLTFDLNTQIENLTAALGSNQITQASVGLQAKGKATGLKQFNLSQYELRVARQGQPLLTVSGSGTYDAGTTNADLQVAGQAALARLLEVMPQPQASLASGTAELKGRLTQKQKTQSFTGNLVLGDLTGRFGNAEFRSFGAALDLDVGMTPQQAQIRKAAGKLTKGANAAGSFEVSGTYNLESKAADLKANLTDINQNALCPLLEPALSDKKLVSVTLNAKASAQYDPQGALAVKADLQVADLVVKDPKNSFPATPLEAKMQVDVSLRQQVADVRQFQIALTPTSRAKNELQLSGQLDMSRTNVIQGKLKLAADSLDVTSYYDLFAGQKSAAGTASERGEAKSTSASPAAEKEPEAQQLPFRNFAVEASIGRLYLREVEIADWQTSVKLDGSRVELNPCKLTLNGAPAELTLDLDLGVPGYKYDMACNAQRIPLAPLMNSFQPERKGQMGGTVTAQARVSGAGVTGASLQKNLAGQFDVSSTNLNLSVANLKSPVLKTLVNVVSLIPELAANPANAVALLLPGLTGKAGSTSGLADELQRSPVNAILARGKVGAGRVDLQQAVVQSAAFEADAQGTISLAAVMTNSAIQIPVSVSLSRPLAQRMNLVPANTPTNAAYAKLPDFLTMKGTIGKPDPQVNKLALAGTVLKGVGGSVPGSGGLLQELGGILTGSGAATTNAAPNAQSNQPATNQSPVNNLLDGLFGPKKK